MAQQKLFTEEQVKNVLKERTFLIDKSIDAMFDTLTPIELPSNEEIEKECNKLPFEKHVDCGMYNDGQIDGFELGAKWMKEQILKHDEASDGFWVKSKYDEKGNRIYYENSDGVIEDNRPKCENKVVAQQTAVEWLVNKIYMVIPNEERNFLQGLKDEANQMFEEQIIKAHGLKYYDINEETVTGEEYYNETFGGQGSLDTTSSPNTQNK